MAEAEAKAQGAAGQEAERELVRYEARGGVALLTLDDPPANTYTYEMMQQLDRAVLRARMDEGVHIVVITGGGEKFFSAAPGKTKMDAIQRPIDPHTFSPPHHSNHP